MAVAWLLLTGVLACSQPVDLPPPAEPPQLGEMDLSVQRLFADLAERVESVRDTATPGPTRAAAYGELGSFYLANGFAGLAEQSFRTASDLDPQADRWLSYLAHALFRQGLPADSLAVLEERLERGPRDTITLLWVAEGSLRQDDLRRAEEALGAARLLDADDELVWLALGHLALGKNEAEQALHCAERARSLGAARGATEPLISRANRKLRRLEPGSKRASASEPGISLREAIERSDPLLRDLARFRVGARRHDQRAVAAESQGRLELALVELRQAIATDPDRVFARLDTANILLRLGRPSEAKGELEALLEEHPQYPPAFGRLAEVEARLGNTEAARSHFERALALDPLSLSTLLAHGAFLAKEGGCTQAREHFARALSLDPGSEIAGVELARCDTIEGRPLDAVRRLETLIAARSDVPTANLVLARLLAVVPAARDRERSLGLAEQLHARYGELVQVTETVAMALAANSEFEAAGELETGSLERCADDSCRQRARQRRRYYGRRRLPARPFELGEELRLPKS